MSEHPFLPLGIFLLGLLLGGIYGMAVSSSWWRKAAVEAGHAEFGASKDGELLWRWKP